MNYVYSEKKHCITIELCKMTMVPSFNLVFFSHKSVDAYIHVQF